MLSTLRRKSLRWLTSAFPRSAWRHKKWFRSFIENRLVHESRVIIIVSIADGAENIIKTMISNHWFYSNLGRWSWGILSRVFVFRISIFLPLAKGLFAETANAANRTIYVRMFGTTSAGNFSNRPTKSKIEINITNQIFDSCTWWLLLKLPQLIDFGRLLLFQFTVILSLGLFKKWFKAWVLSLCVGVSYIDVGDECWWWFMLVPTLRSWWLI